ncbi:hypothetical protein THIX_10362 [Thiomonas sp. X19]|nr:hypothetical protein THIX_10362 [Thiomonas sp. X19]
MLGDELGGERVVEIGDGQRCHGMKVGFKRRVDRNRAMREQNSRRLVGMMRRCKVLFNQLNENIQLLFSTDTV